MTSRTEALVLQGRHLLVDRSAAHFAGKEIWPCRQRILLRDRYFEAAVWRMVAAWWPGKTYIDEPVPTSAMQYAIRMHPNPQRKGDFTLEARVAMAATLGVSGPEWQAPRIGDTYGLEIVHTDPDGGDYGGHFLICGRGDDDSSWGLMQLIGPVNPIQRNSK